MSRGKEAAKSILRLMFGKSANELEAIDLSKYEVVSFDVFSTLILRTCGAPEAVFDLAYETYNHDFPNNNLEDFRRKRIEAERLARSNKEAEVTLAEIYAELDGVSPHAREILCNIEVLCERNVCAPNSDLVSFFNAAANTCRIVIASDMYLPREVVAEILQGNGLAKYETLYVSSESGKTKRDGSLFRLMLEQLSLAPSKVLHIGDHPLSDWLIPKKFGIHACLYGGRLARGR